MNILVTGANGQLGCSLRAAVAQGNDGTKACIGLEDNWFYFADISRREGYPVYFLDITDPEEIGRTVRDYQIDAIINCAAYTDVEGAQDHQDLAEKLNATAVGYLAEAMAEVGGWLFHISTDYVFGGDAYNVPCREDQKGSPTGVYGLTKLHGEQAILSSGCKYVILRTSWLYSEYGRNFLRTMLSLTESRPQLSVVFDQAGTPTYAADLAGAILSILAKGPVQGIFNYSNEGVCSWYDFARAIAEISGHTSCEILPCHSDEFPSKVVRPSYSVLDKTKIKATYGITIPHWLESLRLCLLRLGF